VGLPRHHQQLDHPRSFQPYEDPAAAVAGRSSAGLSLHGPTRAVKGLLRGRTAIIDLTTPKADAVLRIIVCKDISKGRKVFRNRLLAEQGALPAS
jgi:hypothetical protein